MDEAGGGRDSVSPGAALPFHKIRKRDGRMVEFDPAKITDAIFKAVQAVGGSNREIAESLTWQVIGHLKASGHEGLVPAVEEVQDTVEKVLIEEGHARTAKAYILYRDRRTRIREAKTEFMDVVKEILMETHRESANMNSSPSAKMLQIASLASIRYYLSNLLPDDFASAHREGALHIHDLDYYSKTINSIQIDPSRLLEEGFDSGCGYLRPPGRIAQVAAQAAIIVQSNQNDIYGEQCFPHFDRHMGAVIRFLEQQPGEGELSRAMEGLLHSLNTMQSRAGGQIPLTSFNLGADTTAEGRAVSRAVLEALYRGLGRGESPIFPNLVFRIKEGVNFSPADPNYDLYQLALAAASRRMNPTFSFMDSSFNQKYGGEVAYTGCRSRVIDNRHGPEISAGRGNIAYTTINLPRLAFESRGGKELFFVELDRMLRLAARQLIHRYGVVSRLRIRELPFLMGQKLYLGSEKLSPDDQIGEAIRHGTLAIGFAGLAEALRLLAGKHHGEDEEARQLGLKIVDQMFRRCNQFSDEYELNFVLLATPAGNLAHRFVAIDQERFGVIPGVTDSGYTDSFHLPVHYAAGAADKIAIEGRFHRYCRGGHISCVELEAPPLHNPEAIDQAVRQMAAADTGYGAINYPLDECCSCAHCGVFDRYCPKCGSGSLRRIRRTGGRLSVEAAFGRGAGGG